MTQDSDTAADPAAIQRRLRALESEVFDLRIIEGVQSRNRKRLRRRVGVLEQEIDKALERLSYLEDGYRQVLGREGGIFERLQKLEENQSRTEPLALHDQTLQGMPLITGRVDCPRHGREVAFVHKHDGRWRVICGDCGIQTFWFVTRGAALDTWALNDTRRAT